jgi:hypothetical protein
MKKILLLSILILCSYQIFAQRFSQYNTGTLYDSFENPSQRTFIPDSSRQVASNFFIPTLNLNGFLTGNSQATLKSKAFLKTYNNSGLQILPVSNNFADGDINIYLLMLKIYTNLDGDVEMGFSVQTKAEGKAFFTDASAALLNGSQSFAQNSYNNIFNSHYYFQDYHQISFTYRKKVNSQLAFGFKVSSILGIQYKNVNITSSSATFNRPADAVDLTLKGTFHNSYIPNNNLSSKVLLPTFSNPGAAISLGTTYKTEDGFLIQTNVKDLGFIHWNKQSQLFNYDNSEVIHGLTTAKSGDSVYNHVNSLIHNNLTTESYNTPLDGRAELSVNRSYWIDNNHSFQYLPTLVLSKELFYNGFIAALVNPIKFNAYAVTFTTTYDNLKIFMLGTQLMYKTPNFEFYVGTDKLVQSISLASNELSKNQQSILQNNAFTGGSFFIGMTFKFGNLIEHPMNSSSVNGF